MQRRAGVYKPRPRQGSGNRHQGRRPRDQAGQPIDQTAACRHGPGPRGRPARGNPCGVAQHNQAGAEGSAIPPGGRSHGGNSADSRSLVKLGDEGPAGTPSSGSASAPVWHSTNWQGVGALHPPRRLPRASAGHDLDQLADVAGWMRAPALKPENRTNGPRSGLQVLALADYLPWVTGIDQIELQRD